LGTLKTIFLLTIGVLIFTFSSCHTYSFTGASIAPDVKTVTIQYFPNNAPLIQPSLSQVFTEKLKDRFVSQTNLNLINKGGDLYFEGTITGYDIKPMAIQGNDQAALNRLTITVNVKFINKKHEKQNYETAFTSYTDYASTLNLSSVEDDLIKIVTTQLVGDIFNKAVINW
jgi:hypothetical protein